MFRAFALCQGEITVRIFIHLAEQHIGSWEKLELFSRKASGFNALEEHFLARNMTTLDSLVVWGLTILSRHIGHL